MERLYSRIEIVGSGMISELRGRKLQHLRGKGQYSPSQYSITKMHFQNDWLNLSNRGVLDNS